MRCGTGRAWADNIVEQRNAEHLLGCRRVAVLRRITVDLRAEAGADARLRAEGLPEHCRSQDEGVEPSTRRARVLICKAARFSSWFTSPMYMPPEHGEFGEKMQCAALGDLFGSRAAMPALAEDRVGLALQAQRAVSMCRLHHWIGVFASDHGAGTEVGAAQPLRKGVQVHLAARIAGHGNASARVEQRREAQFEGRLQALRPIGGLDVHDDLPLRSAIRPALHGKRPWRCPPLPRTLRCLSARAPHHLRPRVAAR